MLSNDQKNIVQMQPDHKENILYFNNFSWLKKHGEILKVLSEDGEEARFVGGAVKNSLLNREINDFDIATTRTPEEVMGLMKKKKIVVVPTGLKHGTVTVILKGIAYEVTTLRQDVETYGRHADVAFIKSWSLDASRRDFTMNAIYIDSDGCLYDYFDGISDLRNGVVRFIGHPEDRICEDYLRILRFFRFFAAYGIGEPNKDAIYFCAKHKHRLREMSIERVTKEILTMLKYKFPLNAVSAMWKNDILSTIFSQNGGIVQFDEFKKFSEFEQKIGVEGSYLLRLFLIAGENNCLCLSNKQFKHLQALRANMISPFSKKLPKISEMSAMLYNYGHDILLDLICFWVYSDFFGKSDSALLLRVPHLMEKIRKAAIPEFPLSGKMLIDIGVEPGKRMGEIINAAKEYWLESNCNPSGAECLEYIKKMI